MVRRPSDRRSLWMEAQHGAVPEHLHRRVVPGDQIVEPFTQAVTAGIQLVGLLGCEDLLQSGDAGRHRQHIVVVGSGMHEPVLPARVEAAHQLSAAAESPERDAAAEVLAEGDEIRREPERAVHAAGRQPRGHHLIENEHDAMPLGLLPQHGKKLRIGSNAAPSSHHRLDDDRGEIASVLADQPADGIGVVIFAHHIVEWHVHARVAAGERHKSAVVGAVERHHAIATGRGARQADAHEIGFSARIAEAHELDCGEAFAHELGKACLIGIGTTQNQAAG